jgi:UDP-N-acetylglucosamine 2-epimerase (non-hydrolysing)
MPALPIVALGCPGLPDPHVHAGQVARSAETVLDGTELVVVQGDTSSALGGALGAQLAGVPVAHVEAGLRSHDRRNPWKEDFRIAIDAIADLLFAPTELSAANLSSEKVAGVVRVTGNTGIDALIERIPMLRSPSRRSDGKRRLLVTCHRRESWGDGLEAIASCLKSIARRADVSISLVLHPNPRVANDMRRLMGGTPNIELCEPCPHIGMLQWMRDSDLILSDCGGMQEEASTLGIPLLILRDRTERPEGIASGNMLLVGRDPGFIEATVDRLLDDSGTLDVMRTPSFPYGDGRASQRIAVEIENWLQRGLRPAEPLLPSLQSPRVPVAP